MLNKLYNVGVEQVEKEFSLERILMKLKKLQSQVKQQAQFTQMVFDKEIYYKKIIIDLDEKKEKEK